MATALPAGLYAVTDPDLLPEDVLVAAVTAAIAGGAAIVQYRDKNAAPADRLRRAGALAELCRRRGRVFIVNDDPALAAEVEADGVHLGKGDTSVAEARSILGPRRLIGVSCYDRMERAHAAVVEGADYVAFGSVFPSSTKPGAVRAPLSLISAAAAGLPVPVVAIGGITRENAGDVIAAGARAVAVVRDLFGDVDPEGAARAIQTACESARGRLE